MASIVTLVSALTGMTLLVNNTTNQDPVTPKTGVPSVHQETQCNSAVKQQKLMWCANIRV